MTTPIRRRWRLARRGAFYLAAALLVLMALGNAVGSQLLPLVERNPEAIARWLTVRAQRPVAFDAVRTQWTRRGPLLQLDNLRVGAGADAVRIGDAEMLVAQYAGLLPRRSFTELRVRGLDLTLERDPSGRWAVRGLPGQERAGGDPFAVLERLGELQVSDARLRVHAPELGIDHALPRVDVRLRVQGDRLRAGARAWMRSGGSPLDAALDFDRRSGDGRVHAAGSALELADFADLQVAGVAPAAGSGRLRAWAQLQQHRVVRVRAEGALRDVALRARAGTDPVLALGAVELDARWTGSLRQWRADALRLRVGGEADRQVLDGLAMAGGAQLGLRAERIDAGPLLAVMALADGVPERLRQWLRQTAPGAVLEDVAVHGTRGGALQASATVRGLHFGAVGTAPGMRGVSGRLQGDARGLRLQFDPEARVVFDWPAGFGTPLPMTLAGEAVLARDADGWSVRTPGLAIHGDALRLRARGGLGFQGDGSRPRLDLATDIDDLPMAGARRFWVRHLMPKATIDWLDMALQGGQLRGLHAVVAGDLDDWPFRDEDGRAGAGVFLAQARIEQGVLKFHRDWPAAEAVDAEVRFKADGLTVQGRGRIAGVPVGAISGGIPHFRRAELSLQAQAAGDARDFLALLRQSPLHAQYRDTLDNLGAAGPASAELALALPLHRQQPPARRLQGRVELAGASLREERWKLAFDRVRGSARFDQDGFAAEGLQVLHEGAPGTLALRSGPHVREAGQVFEAELQAVADIDRLLDKAGSLDWLKPHVQGRSEWTVAVAVPRGAGRAAAPTRLQLRSRLVGTAISLPEPVRKPAGQPLAATVDVRVPIERGEVDVRLDGLLAVRSRSDGRQTGVQVQFGGGPAPAPPASGLVVGGRVARLDALEWIPVAMGGDGEGEGTVPLRRIDVQAAQLHALGSRFADARLVVVPAARGTAVQVQAPGIAGSLLVPEQDGATVAGRFERLHWALPTKAGAGVAASTAALRASGDGALDPSRIPPLVFEIGDLRLGNAALGSASFRSTPTAAGLRLDEFTTRGGKQRLRASGSWTGRGSAARTALRALVDSDDAGAVLDGLGVGGQLAGGRGTLSLDAGWRGGPDTISPATMDAQLALDVRDGRLLALEPGAGRVLGLLGIAQLPRRLSLDFRDFFDKGFAFDRIHGELRVAGGVARSDDLAILGPAADIHVRGSADLRSQRFDQTVDVLPKSGGLLTAVGALAGGPVGAAVGAVANAVLEKPMQQIGAKTYRVTGPWQSPKVEVTARPSAAQRAALARDPPG